MYAILVNPKKKAPAVRVIRTSKLKSSWASHEQKNFKLYRVVGNWHESQSILRLLKSGRVSLDRDSLKTIKYCWLEDIAQAMPEPTVRWLTPKAEHYVYCLVTDGSTSYIGVTSNPELRVRQHVKSGKHFESMEVLKSFDIREEAESFEIFAIKHIRPAMNRLVLPETEAYVHSVEELECFI